MRGESSGSGFELVRPSNSSVKGLGNGPMTTLLENEGILTMCSGRLAIFELWNT